MRRGVDDYEGFSGWEMDGFTAGLWNELVGSNIHVALVTPGAIDTEIWDKQAEPNAYKGARAPL